MPFASSRWLERSRNRPRSRRSVQSRVRASSWCRYARDPVDRIVKRTRRGHDGGIGLTTRVAPVRDTATGTPVVANRFTLQYVRRRGSEWQRPAAAEGGERDVSIDGSTASSGVRRGRRDGGGHGAAARRRGAGGAFTRGLFEPDEQHLRQGARVRAGRRGPQAPGGAAADRRRERREPVLRLRRLQRVRRLRRRHAQGGRLRPRGPEVRLPRVRGRRPVGAPADRAATPPRTARASTSGRSPRATRATSPRRSRPSTCSSGSATPARADARRPTSRASPPGTSPCSSVATARSRSRPRTPRPPAPSGS